MVHNKPVHRIAIPLRYMATDDRQRWTSSRGSIPTEGHLPSCGLLRYDGIQGFRSHSQMTTPVPQSDVSSRRLSSVSLWAVSHAASACCADLSVIKTQTPRTMPSSMGTPLCRGFLTADRNTFPTARDHVASKSVPREPMPRLETSGRRTCLRSCGAMASQGSRVTPSRIGRAP